ncbi:hypothetical protein CDD81_587 [Ophiocordyceps australis]|uniref:BTB domain-containing protein n=1 Tax=Ophiocordyceps australis TaxID=1399860 RepID=A0A2C5YFJ1_9HYPO|nr:hypothetical protein CDD81_587 [Ophiocordyceps australis]
MIHLKYYQSLLQVDNLKDTNGEEPVEAGVADAPSGEHGKTDTTHAEQEEAQTLDFRASLSHITTASLMADAMFNSSCLESIKRPDGYFHWTIEPLLHPMAFKTVMQIIHGRTRDIHDPEDTSLDAVFNMAVVVDYIRCHGALSFVGRTLIRYREWGLASYFTDDIPKCIFIAQVFEERELFKKATQSAILYSTGPISGTGYNLDPRVVDKIENARQASIESVTTRLHNLIEQLADRYTRCKAGCAAMTLGTLMRGMHALGLPLDRPQKPYLGLSVQKYYNLYTQLKPPTLYLEGCEQDYTAVNGGDKYDDLPEFLWKRWATEGETGHYDYTQSDVLAEHDCPFWSGYFKFLRDYRENPRVIELWEFINIGGMAWSSCNGEASAP